MQIKHSSENFTRLFLGCAPTAWKNLCLVEKSRGDADMCVGVCELQVQPGPRNEGYR